MRLRSILCLLPLYLLSALPTAAQGPTLTTRNVVTGLDTPWEILWGPDNWIWVTERPGRVSRVNPATGETKLLLTLPDVYESGESGLLGMALHPDFPDSAHLYLVYTYQENNRIKEKLVRYTYNGVSLASPVTMIQDLKGNTTHDGSRVLVGPDRKLYITAGDAQDQPAAQNRASLNGKIIRLNLDGTPPADNPWAGSPYPANILWSTGHRNPQGMVFGPTGTLYSSEHGPNNDDEVNIIRKGRNYGWPTVHGYCNLSTEQQFCRDSNVAEPIMAWTPTLAVAGIDYYNHPAIPEWSNSLLMVNLKEQDLRQLKLSQDGMQIIKETTLYNNQYGRLRDLCVAPDGRVFLATSNKDGRGNPGASDDRIIELKSNFIPTTGISAVQVVAAGDLNAGDNMLITFTTNGTFDSANVFTAQLSDSTGSFASPIVLGTLKARNSGTIQGVIPCNALDGRRYRVRVVAGSPAASAENGANLRVRAFAPAIAPSGDTTICAGGIISLDAGAYPGVRWSTGDTTRMITVSQGGAYSATVTSAGGCVATTPAITVTVAERPRPDVAVSVDGDAVLLQAPVGFTSYQWYRVFVSTMGDDTIAIDTAKSRTLRAPAGRYMVRVTDGNGCEGPSTVVLALLESVAWEKGSEGLLLYPHPARDRVTLEMVLERGASVEIVVTDMAGVDLLRIEEPAPEGRYRREVMIGELPAGSYILRLHAGGKHWRGKFVKM